MTKEEYIARTIDWYYCDNIVHEKHRGQIGLLHMAEPQVFILVRDENTTFSNYEDFKAHCAELNFFNPTDREKYNKEEILIDAYNFCLLQEHQEREYVDHIEEL